MIKSWTESHSILGSRLSASSVAQYQLEYTKSDAFQSLPATYDVIPDPPPNYSVTVEASAVPSRDANLQKIVVTVYHQGELILAKEGYKVDR